MKIVIQRVLSASVEAYGITSGKIGKGILILFGAGINDTDDDCVRLAEKISKLRIFEDENGKTNLSIKEVGGEVLCVSQFTLLADCSSGNRPSFTDAAPPAEAKRLYDLFISELKKRELSVKTGIFSANMKVSLVNNGPFTIILE